MPVPAARPTVSQHFGKCEPQVRLIYDAILHASRSLGSVVEDPNKSSIHLKRKTAFAGVTARKSALILTLKSETDLPAARIHKRERVSANRWHLEVRLESPGDVDRQLKGWLAKAYEISG